MITIKTAKGIPVKNDDGEIEGYLHFDPADPTVLARFKAMLGDLQELATRYDGEDADRTLEGLLAIDDMTRNKLDAVCGKGASDLLFRYYGPYSRMESGERYIELILSELMDLISATMDREREASEKRVNDRIAPYAARFAADAADATDA